ncbi:MAG: helix-turn-helix transcriptional regulator [Oscillospiraceae bacterium]|nr:helix-turn-helix transcriptional regulator [Oscillospiraceae bacterium]
MTTGEKIKMLREKDGLSQVELAERIGETKQTIYKYENDIVDNIPKKKIEAIAKIFDVEPGYLYGWTDNRQTYSYEEFIKKILSDDEHSLIKAYRTADDVDRRAVRRILGVETKKDTDVLDA